ncbi:hypothetical protein CDD81_7291 [Ophiocordyceps australis]|uniref:Modin n=1 Tax=Ophiocordyceps australis TaxID=1399860 RepID=A0A2C5Y3S6_9HYPO|nr:hypothetical protein CDD81_7291 [Ophiocordyceps australis]
MGGDNELIVAVVALVVSFVALSATFMQVLQQYYASASGYSQCNDKVMGKWADSKTRRFSWKELRFEVHFDTPVIFVSPPDNESGPIDEAPIFFLNGSSESLAETKTFDKMNLRQEYKDRTVKEQIHTADNERASWHVLLYAIQRMESKSRQWQEGQYQEITSSSDGDNASLRRPLSLRQGHTFTVALQRKRRSWDTMPASVSRPYATTTMCHLIEIVAALGIYWKEFDRRHDRYRAEGNGFMVLGERLSDLGLIFSFEIYGECYFQRNRVIPEDHVKELCFGNAATIYREKSDMRRLRALGEEGPTLNSLQLATRAEIAETLTVIGCNRNTVQYYLGANSRTSHLFPLSFELLGMLSRTFQIDDTYFTYIPNPTPDRWDGNSVSLVKVLEAYQIQANNYRLEMARNGVIFDCFASHIQTILGQQEFLQSCEEAAAARDPRLLKALHAALDDADEILTAKPKQTPGPPSLPTAETMNVRECMARRELVQDVLRSHFQEILRLLNHHDDTPHGGSSIFDAIDEASPDERQHRFMEGYFQTMSSHFSGDNARNLGNHSMPGPRANLQATSGNIATDTAQTSTAERMDPFEVADGPNEHGEDATQEGGLGGCRTRLAEIAVSRGDVWCVLIFRMICWLMLHDFNKQDVQIGKSELLGSRMPVYIA